MQVGRTLAIAVWRLHSQQLHQLQWQQPEQIVQWLGGVQAQNATEALWSMGLRLRDCTSAEAQRAIEEQRIVRTWVFRGTLHYIAATDLFWLLQLLAPMTIRRNARRYRQLDLDETMFAQSNQVIRSALEPGKPLIRAEIARALEDRGISAAGQRVHYLVQRAALDAVICQGVQRGREPTYMLVSEWIGAMTERASPRQPLAALAERYFSSHGPATVQDFAWWSGLPVTTARQALETAQSLVQVETEGYVLWAGRTPSEPSLAQMACLLPPYDEYLLGYRDRTQVLDPTYAKRVNAGGGMPKPTIVLNGKIVGTWKRTFKNDRIQMTLDPFAKLVETERLVVERAAQRYGAFWAVPIELEWSDTALRSP